LDFIKEAITEWIMELLISGILSNLSGMFDSVNEKVAEIADVVSLTPQQWNSAIFNMVESLSETVIMPVAGVILTFVACYELIQMVIDKNTLHDVDSWMFFRWFFKTCVAVMIITNTWNIIMGIFELSQSVVNSAAGVAAADAAVDIGAIIPDLESRLMDMEVGALLGLWFQSLIVGITMWALVICILVVVFGRMTEIYLVSAVAPIPMATMANREWGQMGQNYLKSLFALGFQAFLIIICVAIYAALVNNIATVDDISKAIWTCMGYTVLLCFSLFKTGSLAKSVLSAH